jgi:hypothetical protein
MIKLIGGDGISKQVLLAEGGRGIVRLTQEAFRDASMSIHHRAWPSDSFLQETT